MRYAIVILIVFASCSRKNDQVLLQKERSESTIAEIEIDIPADSTLYIGTIEAFENTQEFYTPLYFKQEIGDAEYSHVHGLTDSIIYQGDEIQRKLMPFDQAMKYFNLNGLRQISIYNDSNQLLSKANLLRVEYVQDFIEGEFVAVFKSERYIGNNEHGMYCLGQTLQKFTMTDARCEVVSDPVIDEAIAKAIGVVKEEFTARHHKDTEHNKVYSIVSLDSLSFITEWDNTQLNILKELKTDHYIYHIQPIAVEVNGKPVLLADFAVHESDVQWSAPLAFYKKEYVAAEQGRIR
jgi:hypothetical protein